jgi:hypothetical protein
LTPGPWLVFGSGDGPATGSVVHSEDGQAGEVEGAGAGQDVGQDAFLAAAPGFSAAPGAAGEVADLAFHDGPVGPVGVLPGRILLAGFGVLQAASWEWMLITRPRRALVPPPRHFQPGTGIPLGQIG